MEDLIHRMQQLIFELIRVMMAYVCLFAKLFRIWLQLNISIENFIGKKRQTYMHRPSM